MKIILDTNIVYGDFFLQSIELKSLCLTAHDCGFEVLIPRVVVDEIINQYREYIIDIESQYRQLNNKLNKATSVSFEILSFNKENLYALIKQYSSVLNDRLKELYIDIIPYPVVSHEQVVTRDLLRRKPFQNSGKGYRDTLLWESILSICHPTDCFFKEPQIVFVNQNTKDFCENDGLHCHLKEDLSKLNVSEDDFKIFPKLSDVTKTYIIPLQQRQQELLNRLREHPFIGCISIADKIRQSIESTFETYIENADSDYFYSIFGELENPDLQDIRKIKFDISDIRRLPDETFIIDIEASAHVYIEAFLFKGNHHLIEQDALYVIDNNWNRHYVLVGCDKIMHCNITLNVNKAFDYIKSITSSVDTDHYPNTR